MGHYTCDYQNFYLDDNNELCFDIPPCYYYCWEYLNKLQKLCENIILCKKITLNDSENKYIKCLSTVSFDWIKQTFNIDLCFGWWLKKIIKHVKWLEYFVYVEKDGCSFHYIKGFEFVHDEFDYYPKHKIIDDDFDYEKDCKIRSNLRKESHRDFVEILHPTRYCIIDNKPYSELYDILGMNYWISYVIKSQYKDNKVVPITDDDGEYINESTGKLFEDTNDYISNTSQAVFKHLYDLQQAMRNNHMTDKLTSQINAVTTKLDKFISKHKNDCEHLRMDVDTCADITYKNMKNQKVYCDETNLYVNDLQDRISRLESLLCDNVDSQIIDRILNINKESESLEQIVKKQQQTINELQEELKKQREEFEEYKSQRQQQLAAIMSQM